MEQSIPVDLAHYAASAIGFVERFSMDANEQDENLVADVLSSARAYMNSNGRRQPHSKKTGVSVPNKSSIAKNSSSKAEFHLPVDIDRRNEEMPKNKPGRRPFSRSSGPNVIPGESTSGRERSKRLRNIESDNEDDYDNLSLMEQLRRDKKHEKMLIEQEKALAADQEVDLTVVRPGTLRLVDWIRFHRIYHAGGIQIRYKKIPRSKNSEAGYVLILNSSTVEESEDGSIDIQTINGDCPDLIRKLLEPHILPPRRATNQHRYVLLHCDGKRWELVDWYIINMKHEESSLSLSKATVLAVPNNKRKTMCQSEGQPDSSNTPSQVRSGPIASTQSRDQQNSFPKPIPPGCGLKVIRIPRSQVQNTSSSCRETNASANHHRHVPSDFPNQLFNSATFTAVRDPEEGHRYHLNNNAQQDKGKGLKPTGQISHESHAISSTSCITQASAVQHLRSVHSDGIPPLFSDQHLPSPTNNERELALVRRPKKRIFFPRPVSVTLVHVKLTDSPTESPGLSLQFEGHRGPNKPFCPTKTIINLPLENEDDQYFMVAMNSLPEAGVVCPGTEEAKISLKQIEVLSFNAMKQQQTSFIKLWSLGEEFITLPESCSIYSQPGLPRHVFLGPFSAHLSATCQHMISIKPFVQQNGNFENTRREFEPEEDVGVVDRKPTILKPIVPTRKLLSSIRFKSSWNIELFCEEVVRVRIPFFKKKFVGPINAFKEWLSVLTMKMNSGNFECGDSSKESLVEISSDEEEEPFIKPEPWQEENGRSAEDESISGFSRSYPVKEEVAILSWLSEALPIYGQKWIGVKHPFRQEKYVLFRSEKGARNWAKTLVETVRSGQAIRCAFPDQMASTNDVHLQQIFTSPSVKPEIDNRDKE